MKAQPMYVPASLPGVQRAEVLLLERGAFAYPPNLNLRETRGFSGETAQQLATLWRTLAGKSWMRCHNPVYGLRFLGETDAIVEANVCWECNNIRLSFPDGSTGFCAFNAQTASAQMLLALCKALLPRSPELQALTPEQCRRVEDALESKPGAAARLNTTEELHAFVATETIVRPVHVEALWHILRHPQCARGTAQTLFWQLDPLFWLSHFASADELAAAPSRLRNLSKEALHYVPMLLELQQRYLGGFYTRDTVAVDPAVLTTTLSSPKLKVPIADALRQPVWARESLAPCSDAHTPPA